MGCCGKTETRVESLQREDEGEKEFEGPVKKRSCRDVICLIIFIVFILGLFPVGYLAVAQGNPYRLIYGVDSWGNVCNQKNEKIEGVTPNLTGVDTTGKMKTFYFDPSFFTPMLPSMPTLEEKTTTIVCIEKCPTNVSLQDGIDVDNYRTETGINLCAYNVKSYVDDETKCPSTPILGHVSIFHRCIPEAVVNTLGNAAKAATSSFSALALGKDLMQKVMSDLKNTWVEILQLGGVSVGVALLVVIMMRCLATFIVWFLVFLVVALTTAAAAYCWYTWFQLRQELEEIPVEMRTEAEKEKIQTWFIYSCIATGVMCIIMLILLVLRKRIGLVVQLFKEAGKAIGAIPGLLFLPLWTLIILIVVLAGLALLSLFVETSGLPVINPSTGHVKYEFEDFWNYIRWYNLFAILWISAFITACQDMVIAGAVTLWYFQRDKQKLGTPLLDSIRRLIRYHLGSIAFGSFIIALVRLARIILGYIQKKLQGRAGKVAEFIMKVLQCCLWCFEKFLQFLNRNAYIEIAIYGKDFCTSARKAFTVIVNNALRVAAINSIGDFVLFLGKLCTVAIVMILGHEYFKHKDGINYYWVPTAVACAFAFAVSHCFLLVYEITIDTIFVCFCEDCEYNDGVHKPFFMSKSLMKYLDDTEKATAAKSQFAKQKGKTQNDTETTRV